MTPAKFEACERFGHQPRRVTPADLVVKCRRCGAVLGANK